MNKSFAIALALLFVSGCGTVKRWGIHAPENKKDFFQVRWAKAYDSLYTTGNLPITVGGVTIGDGIVYVGALDGGFHALDSENGRELWSFDEKSPLTASSLVSDGNVFYGTQGGRLIVRQAVTGELKYAIDLGAPIESAPVIHEGRLIVYMRGHQIVCLDALTGKIIWNYRRAVPITVTLQRTTRPLFIGDKVIVGFADGYAGALSLHEGILQWEQKLVDIQKFVDVDINPIISDGLIVTGSPSGELKALDSLDGSIRRNYTIGSLSQPILRGTSLVFGTDGGEVIFMAPNGEILKRHRVSKKPINHLVWWKDNLVAITFGGDILGIDPLTFKEIGRFSLGHDQSAVFGDLALSEKGLGVLSSRNRLFFFE